MLNSGSFMDLILAVFCLLGLLAGTGELSYDQFNWKSIATSTSTASSRVVWTMHDHL